MMKSGYFNKLFYPLLYILLTASLLPAGCTTSPAPTDAETPAAVQTKTTLPTTAETTMPKETRTQAQSGTATIIEPSKTTAAPAEKSDSQHRTSYKIKALLNYEEHKLSVEEEIRYFNKTNDLRQEILFVVEPKYYQNVFHLKQITVNDSAPLDIYSWENNLLFFQLNTPLQPDDAVNIKISYELTMPLMEQTSQTSTVVLGYTTLAQNYVDWYPYIPPYSVANGWVTHPKGYYGEHLVYESANFDVSIKILDQRDDLIIAASAKDMYDGEWHHYTHNAARNFVWSISDQYIRLSTTVGKTTVFSYVFSKNEEAGKSVLQTTADAIKLYSELFAPYQRDTISAVEADFHDGMEYDGLYFLSKGFYNLYTGTPGEYLVSIAAHETAHQWWYAIVGNDQAIEPWLDEAMCTYTERLFYEFVHPEALDWWWDYRVNYYQPRGWVDMTIYNPYTEQDAYRTYRDAVYLNGAVFLENLRKQIGDAAFFDFLKAYAATYRYKIATTDTFFNLLYQFTDVDLKALEKEFFAKR